jgi:hypothetical protein
MSTVVDSVGGSLQPTLQGYRAMLERQLGLSGIAVFINERQRQEKLRKTPVPSYPYSWIMLQELRAFKDIASGKNIARHGWFTSGSGATQTTTEKHYMWPVAIGTEVHVVHDDPLEIMRVAERMVITSMTDALNFSIEVLPGVKTMVRAEVPDTVSIPLAETDNAANPDSNEIVLQIALYSWIGFSKDVNRASGTVGASTKVTNANT